MTQCNEISSGFGVLYLAFGAPYLAMASLSAATVRASNPEVPICIVTDVTSTPLATAWWRDSDYWIYTDQSDESSPSSGYAPKVRMWDYSPFRKTLFLDCDTIVLKDVTLISQLLEYFDLAMMPTDNPGQDRKRVILGGTLPYDRIGHFNSGVLAFGRSASAKAFFSQWTESYSNIPGRRDQPSLLEALYLTQVRVVPLQAIWNAGFALKESPRVRDEIVVWHYKVRVERGVDVLLRQTVDWWNASEQHRVEVDRFLKTRSRWRTTTKTGIGSSIRDIFRSAMSDKIKLPTSEN